MFHYQRLQGTTHQLCQFFLTLYTPSHEIQKQSSNDFSQRFLSKFLKSKVLNFQFLLKDRKLVKLGYDKKQLKDLSLLFQGYARTKDHEFPILFDKYLDILS